MPVFLLWILLFLGTSLVALADDSSDLQNWKSFEDSYVFGEGECTWPEAVEALSALKNILQKRGIFCTTYPPNLQEDLESYQNSSWGNRDVSQLAPPRKMRLTIGAASRAPKNLSSHPLCKMADQKFWDSEVSTEFCYVISNVTAPSIAPMEGNYLGNDLGESGFFLTTMLSPDFFHRLLLSQNAEHFIQTHEGLQFSLVQHEIHNQGRQVQKLEELSPFYVSLLDGEAKSTEFALWRIPAVNAALRALKRQMNLANSTSEKNEIQEKIDFYLERGKQEKSYAENEVRKIKEALLNDSAKVDFQKEWDGMLWTTVYYLSEGREKRAVFYFPASCVDLEEEILRKLLLERVSTTLRSISLFQFEE